MKVLHIVNTAGYSSGGIGDVAQELFRHQREMGVDVSLWFPGDQPRKREVEEITEEHGEHVCAIPSLAFGENVLPYGIIPFFAKMKGFDLIHQHGIWLPTSLLTSWASRHLQTIISPHGLLEPFRLSLSQRKKRFVGAIYENRNLRNARCLSACSLQEAIGLRAYGLNQEIAIIPNGVSGALLDIQHDKDREGFEFRRAMSLPPSSSIVLFLSRLHPIKGIELLVSAVNSLKAVMRQLGWILVIVGDGEASYKESLKSQIALFGVEDIVRIVGPLYGKEKVSAYCAAEVFALVSHNENFGIVVAEALAMGVPVLTSTKMPWGETEKEGCGVVVESSEQGVTDGLRRMLALSGESRMNMGARGQEYARQRFSWSAVSAGFLEVYEWMLGGKRPMGTVVFKGPVK